jgi:Protein of unknown function (DUF3179)
MSQALSGPNAEPIQQDQMPPRAAGAPVKLFARCATIAAIIVLSGFVVAQARSLWTAWTMLQVEKGDVDKSNVIGYRDVAPLACYADQPDDWFRREGDQALIWAKWEAGVGNRWFQFRHGDIDPAHLSRPRSIFVSRPIDYPLIETAGGEIWQRIPLESPVVGQTLLGLKCVYPALVLAKVLVVNDVIDDHPFLVVDNVFAPIDEAYSIFDANLNGRRVTMAATGYFYDKKPVLCDRGAQCLWVEEQEGLSAVTGKHRGQKLARLAHPTPVSWKTWLSQNQTSRLVVGADRTRGVPIE